MLIGIDFFLKVKDFGDVLKIDLVCGCGYVFIKKDGSEWVNFMVFYEVLFEVKGVSFLNGGGFVIGKGGCKFFYKVVV